MCALASPVFICKIPSDAIIALLEPLVPAFLNLSVRDVFAVPSKRRASPSAKTLN